MNWLTRLFRRGQLEEELERELADHVERRTAELMAAGLEANEAARQARLEFGASDEVKELCRDVHGTRRLEDFIRDCRYGLRTLRHNPAFTITALMTLAIGIGANAAVFSVINSVLLKPLQYPEPDELVSLRQLAPGAAGLANFHDGLFLSPSMYFTYSEQNRTFQSLGVWASGTANVTGISEPEQVRVVYLSDGVLQTLEVPPATGRCLSAADQIPQGTNPAAAFDFGGLPTTVMLGYGYWQRRFGGDPAVIGRTITVDSRPREIVGVMPEGFRFVNTESDLIVPLAFARSRLILAGFGYQGIARLKPGVTIAQANADLGRMLPIWMDSWSNGPGTNGRFYERWKITPAIRSLKEEVVGGVSQVLWVVMGTIGLVMLIACANVTNLMLVRAEVRQQELALRSALGAGRSRIVRALMVESAILGLMGGALGFVVAYGGVRLLATLGPANLPRLNEISVDLRTFGFTLFLSLLSATFFGAVPALKYAGRGLSLVLGSAGRTSSVSRDRRRARNVLVVAQVAIALVLLVSAGLMIRTFQALRAVDPGFTDAAQLQTIRIAIPNSLIPEEERVIRTQNDIADKLAAIPGVSSAAFGSAMPLEGYDSMWDSINVENKPDPAGEVPPLRFYKYVAPGFFHTAGTRIVAGRELTWTDMYDLRPVVMVSENLARELWGTPAAAVGKRIRQFSGMPWREIIGVARDVRETGADQPATAIVYWPSLMQFPGPQYRKGGARSESGWRWARNSAT